MRRSMIVTALCAAMLTVSAAPAAAKGKGLTQQKVEDRGWTCFPGETMVHCVRPNAVFWPPPAAIPSLNFSLDDGSFLGTEILIRADLGSSDRPCRQGTEPDGTYQDVHFDEDGVVDYYSCHHNNG